MASSSEPPSVSRNIQFLKSLVKPEASKQYAELMVQMKKDPELEPIIAELESNGHVATFKYWDDKDVLKKIGKSLGTCTLCDVEASASASNKDDEEVSKGKKAMKIVSEYGKLKCVQTLLAVEEKEKRRRERKERRSRGASVTLQNSH